jgi:hypothetical protein
MVTCDNDTNPESLFEAGKRFYFPNQHNCYDPDLALQYFQKAALQGYTPAQRLYGICLLEGNYCPKDLCQAVHFLSLAAEKHDPQASYTLALLYAKGEGVNKNWGQAFRLLNNPEVLSLAEARALKIKLKHELIQLYPNLITALEREEKILRYRLPPAKQRSFPLFWSKLEDDTDEFNALLALNLKNKTPDETMSLLKAKLDSYYHKA